MVANGGPERARKRTLGEREGIVQTQNKHFPKQRFVFTVFISSKKLH